MKNQYIGPGLGKIKREVKIKGRLSFDFLIPKLEKVDNLLNIKEISHNELKSELYVRLGKDKKVTIFHNVGKNMYQLILEGKVKISTRFRERYTSSRF